MAQVGSSQTPQGECKLNSTILERRIHKHLSDLGECQGALEEKKQTVCRHRSGRARYSWFTSYYIDRCMNIPSYRFLLFQRRTHSLRTLPGFTLERTGGRQAGPIATAISSATQLQTARLFVRRFCNSAFRVSGVVFTDKGEQQSGENPIDWSNGPREQMHVGIDG